MFMRTIAIAALAAGVAASSASADPTYSFRNNDAAARWSGQHHHHGTPEPVWSAFDPVSNRLLFEASFMGAFADGLALASDPANTPRNRRSEMTRFYSDTTGRRGADLTGRRFADSARFRAAREGGDGIAAEANSDPSGEPALTLSIDAAEILGFRPGGGLDDRSSDSFGSWLHSLRRFDVINRDRRVPGASDTHGLGDLEDSRFDGADLPIAVVPLPTGAAMAALGLAGIAARRRRA